jgi:putative transposase
VANDFEATVVECNGEENHIHLLVQYHPKISISSLVRSMKGVSKQNAQAGAP